MVVLMSRLSTKLYAGIAKPILFRFSADFVHAGVAYTGRIAQRIPLLMPLLSKLWRYNNPKLEQRVATIQFKNPIGLSAGFDKEARLIKLLQSIGFGLAEVGSITALPYEGNKKPWYSRLPHTKSIVVNSGLRSSGVAKIANRADNLPKKLYSDFPINASVAKTNSLEICSIEDSVEDYCTSLRRLENSPWPSLYTINISCPNTKNGEPFNNPKNLSKLLNAIDKLQLSRPVFLKLPINLGWKKTRSLIEVAKSSSIDGINIGNLSKNRDLVDDRDNLPTDKRGNLSGKPCWEASNDLLAHTYAEYGDRFILIGVGGVFTAEEAYTKIRLGATLVELITGMIFQGPAVIGTINRQLAELLDRDGLNSISDAIGLDAKKYLEEQS